VPFSGQQLTHFGDMEPVRNVLAFCGMTFKEGQQVRVKNQPLTGRVAKKLSSLDDVYVIVLDPAPAPEEKLVRGADLELISVEGQESA
jgi:hypothetical protein